MTPKTLNRRAAMKLIQRIKELHRPGASTFLPSFYATVLGILLSIGLAAWLDNRQKHTRILQSLTLVREELQVNLKASSGMYKRIRLEKRACRYMARHIRHPETLSQDSLDVLGLAPLTSIFFEFTTDAMAALREGGLLTEIPDGDLIMSLIRAYRGVQSLVNIYDDYLDKKSNMRNATFHGEERHSSVKNEDLREYWGRVLSRPEGRLFVRELPNIQSSQMYRNKIAAIESALEHLETFMTK